MKNIFKLIMISLAALSLNLELQAQIDPGAFGYYQDALRFTERGQYGTARVFGLAGAGSTLGGDMSSTFLNPAGLGLYNRNQFALTPAYSLSNYSTSYNGANINGEEELWQFPQAGAVLNFNKSDLIEGGWRGATLGITYNRLNNFNQNLEYGAFNDNSSIIDAMIDNAFGFFPSELIGIEQVGYDHYLINPDPNDQTSYLSFVSGLPFQSESLQTSGFVDQFNISVGGNYDDKVYVGAGVGIVNARYRRSRIYNESFDNSELSTFTVDELLSVRGNGFNANVGVILRPSQFLRIGASVTSPTWYNFSEEGDAVYTSIYNDYDVADFRDEDGNRIIQEDTVLGTLQTGTDLFVSDYNIRTPVRYNVGSTLQIGKLGFITADVEFLDYSSAKISSNDFNETADNNTINSIYQSTMNARFGAEIRLSVLRLRAGFALLGDPYDNSFDGGDNTQQIYSAGIGVYAKGFFADLGLSRTNTAQGLQSYSFFDGTGPVGITDLETYQGRLTVGFNF